MYKVTGPWSVLNLQLNSDKKVSVYLGKRLRRYLNTSSFMNTWRIAGRVNW